MRSFTGNRFPVKKLLMDSTQSPFYLNTDMSTGLNHRRAHLHDVTKACSTPRAL